MNKRTARRFIGIARGLLECPTAPLMEQITARHVWDFAGKRPALFRRRDTAGNVLVGYPASGRRTSAPLVVVAHLDHPAFHVARVDGPSVRLRFRGGVGIGHVRTGTRVRFYARGNAEPTGRGMLTRVSAKKGRVFQAEARLRSGRASPGGFATWDLPVFGVRGAIIEALACDDLMGCAALLCALDELERTRPRGAAIWALFTRAEEIGFYGALVAAQEGLLPRGARVVSLETSRASASAPQGGGVIVRVGDAASVFDPALSGAVRHGADDLAKTMRGFKYQRRLMDGGSCEANAFAHAGYRATGLSLPLGNYHNQAGLDGGRKAIGPESVHADDFFGAVSLLLHMAKGGGRWARWETVSSKRMKKLESEAAREIAEHPL
jgi:putative aminopeptidase FrvX